MRASAACWQGQAGGMGGIGMSGKGGMVCVKDEDFIICWNEA